MTIPIQHWKIRIQGYGTFDFAGTEAEAEKMRAHKANWERGVGIKWRVNNQTDLDKKMQKQAEIWDDSDRQ